MNTLTQQICRDYQTDSGRTLSEIHECLELGRKGESGGIHPNEFSLRALAEGLITDSSGDVCGHRWVNRLNANGDSSLLVEAGEGVDLTAFSNITGQLVYSKILEGYQNPAFVFSNLIPSQPTKLNGERLPGATRLGDVGEEVREGMPYPRKGFTERYLETPPTVKHGLIVPVTKEAIFFDRTNLVLKRASEVGESLGLNKEKRLVDVVIGAVNNYNENGTAIDTFQAASPWSNLLGINDLEDWTDIDNALQQFADMTDPDTNEPILVGGNHLVVTPKRQFAARRIIGSSEVHTSTDGGNQVTVAGNPVAGMNLQVSVVMYHRLQSQLGLSSSQAAQNWLIGDFHKAFGYMENWPITVTQAPLGAPADFEQDIIAQFKASERGVAVVLDPRMVIKSTH